MTAQPTLLLIAIGPVQEFIASARRMRDLWSGSHLLSEIAKQVAKSLESFHADSELLFPPIGKKDRDERLTLSKSPVEKDKDGRAVYIVGNKILTILPPGQDAQKAVEVAETAARRTLWDFVFDAMNHEKDDGKRAVLVLHDTLKEPVEDWLGCVCGGAEVLPGPGSEILETAFGEQLDTLLEFYAVWRAIDPEDDYSGTLGELEQEMAGVKTLRPFYGWSHQRGGVPKSSLDGVRETVLRKDAQLQSQGTPVWLSDGEQLDAIGLVKRAAGDPETFLPLFNLTMASWLDELMERCGEAVADFDRACKGAGDIGKLKLSQEHRFCRDAAMLREERWGSLAKDETFTPNSTDDATASRPRDARQARMKWLRKHVGKDLLRRAFSKGLPANMPSYVACVVADGDRMGQALQEITKGLKLEQAKKHQQRLSEALSSFAGIVRQITEQIEEITSDTCDTRRGEPKALAVYVGGDDVLGFVCLTYALAYAKALEMAFARLMEKAFEGLEGADQIVRPTLSVGVGIAHAIEDMARLLDLGRDAEKLAKGNELPKAQQRNALAVIVDKRSGDRLSWRSQWGEEAAAGGVGGSYNDDDPFEVLGADVELFNDQRLSHRKIFQVRDAWRRAPVPGVVAEMAEEECGDWLELLREDVTRILARSEVGEAEGEGHSRLSPEDVHLTLGAGDYRSLYEEIGGWLDRMLIARLFHQECGEWFCDYVDAAHIARIVDEACQRDKIGGKEG